MCGGGSGGGSRDTRDYAAEERASKAEADRIKAENEAKVAEQARKDMEAQQNQAREEAIARTKRRTLLRAASDGQDSLTDPDDEALTPKESDTATSTKPKKAKTVLAGVV